MKKSFLFLIILIAALIIVNTFIIFSFRSITKEPDMSLAKNIAASVNDQGSSVDDCGSVSDRDFYDMERINFSIKNDVISCMSDKLKNCELGQIKFSCTTSNCSEGILSITDNSLDKCTVKSTDLSTLNSISCEFTKSFLSEYYDSGGEKSWLASVSMESMLDYQINVIKSDKMELTNEEGKKISVQCKIGK